MCGGYFGGMGFMSMFGAPFMWMGGSFWLIALVLILGVGGYFLGTRSHHKE